VDKENCHKHNIPASWADTNFSTSSSHHSSVIGFTEYKSLTHLATHVVRKLTVVVKENPSLTEHQYWADSASNSRTAAMLPLAASHAVKVMRQLH
jgi:hypothetical protein